MRAERIELLHSPWLIELGAFYLNSGLDKVGNFKNSFGRVSCDNLNEDQPVMKLILPNSIELEFDLTCAICLVTKTDLPFPWSNVVCIVELISLMELRSNNFLWIKIG